MTSSSTMFLLGAGASADGGLPVSAGLTEMTLERLSRDRHQPDLAHALNFVVAVIVAHDARLGDGLATDRPDIERVASAVELLAKRGELEIAPFVGSWDGALGSFETRPPRLPIGFDTNLAKALTGKGSATSSTPDLATAIEEYLTERAKGRTVGAQARKVNAAVPNPKARDLSKLMKQLVEQYATATSRDLFGQLFAAIVSGLPELLTPSEPDSFDYLQPLLPGHGDATQTTIATLNYDVGLETAADRAGVPVSAGVEEWSDTGHLKFPSDTLRLLKLHGSLDWQRVGGSSVRLTGPSLRVSSDRQALPFLVFGQREKLRAEGPFLQLLEEFRSTLRGSTTLVSLGYGFRDPHINEIIGRWLNAGPQTHIALVDPFYDPAEQRWTRPVDFRSTLHTLNRDSAADRTERVVYVKETTASFLAQLELEGGDAFIDSLFESPGDAAAPVEDGFTEG